MDIFSGSMSRSICDTTSSGHAVGMKHDEILAILKPAAKRVDAYLARFKERPELMVNSYAQPLENRLYGNKTDPVKVNFENVDFNLGDIESKWGFGDGDILDEFFAAWGEARGWRDEDGNAGYPYVREHELLWQTWLKFLQPVSGIKKSKVIYMGTCHNPVRVDGDFDGDKKSVEVSVADLTALADHIFTPKTGAWLRTYCLFSVYNLRRGASARVPEKLADILEPALLQLPNEIFTVFFDLLSCKRASFDTPISFTDCAILTAGAVAS